MTIALYDASIPVFKQMLSSLGHVLAKAESHANDKKIAPEAIFRRVYIPTCFP